MEVFLHNSIECVKYFHDYISTADLSKSDMNTALMWMVTHFLNSTRPAAKKVLVVASSAQSTDDDASPEGLFNPKLGLQRLGKSF